LKDSRNPIVDIAVILLALVFSSGPAFAEPFSSDEESAEKPLSKKRYGGKTLEEWRRDIKDLSPDNPANKKAVPGLLAILKDRDVPWFTRRQVANTLGRLGKLAPEGVPALIEILDEPGTEDETPRIWATKALAIYGPVARQATPRLVEILKNPELPLAERQVVIDALGQIGGKHPQAIPALVDTLNLPRQAESPKAQEANETLRMLAVESLGQVGTDAAIAVPALVRYLNHPSEPMRRKTAQALGQIGPAAQLAVSTLVESLAYDESPAVRDAAESALAGIGQPALADLTNLLDDREAELRRRAARSLGEMQSTAEPAVPELKKLLKDEDPAVRLTAAKSLWQIRGKAGDSLPVLVETLESPDRQLRIEAFRVLTRDLGKEAAPARGSISELLDHPDPAVRQAARKTLEELKAKSDGETTD